MNCYSYLNVAGGVDQHRRDHQDSSGGEDLQAGQAGHPQRAGDNGTNSISQGAVHERAHAA